MSAAATVLDRSLRGETPREVVAQPSWGSLALFLLSTLYVWSGVWLVAFVALPTLVLGLHPTVVSSGSMAPLIGTGDIVLLEDVDVDALSPGAVIAFDDPARPGTQTLHRIVDVHPDGAYRTKGDANAVPDSTPVPAARVVGAGALLVPYIGLPLLWLRTAPVLALAWFVVTGVALLLAVDVPTSAPSSARPTMGSRVGAAVGHVTGRARRAADRRDRRRRPVVRTAPLPGAGPSDDGTRQP